MPFLFKIVGLLWVGLMGHGCFGFVATGVGQELGNRPVVISHGSRAERQPDGFPSLHPRTRSTIANHSIRDASNYQVASGFDDAAGIEENDEFQNAGELQNAGEFDAPDRSDESRDAVSGGLSLDATPESSRSKMTGPLVTVCSSLAIVLALFSALVWVGRRFGGGAAASRPLPASALTPMGHVMLDPRTKLLLVKCGRRILVLSQTSSGITPITEVTDPDEVRELIANCSAEARAVFEKTLREIELEPARGFTGRADEPISRGPHTGQGTAGNGNARTSGRLFATA